MAILILFAFLAGIVTVLSPCILPLLPIILAGSSTQDRNRPAGVVMGFVGSFTLFTLALSAIVKKTGASADALRTVAIGILLLFGLTLVIPVLKHIWERIVSTHLPASSGVRHGFGGGLVIGLSLGVVWTPCVGPILASVITLAASSTVTAATTLITLAYSFGTAIPLFLIMRGSSWFMNRFGWLKSHASSIEKIFGLLMIGTSLMLYFQLDRRFQTFILTAFPRYGAGLTAIENTPAVQQKLSDLQFSGGSMSALKVYGRAPELVSGGNWINSEPLTLAGLRGKVVLVDFWTYSCINCIRTLPYLKAWNEKYKDQGLIIIGVHSPEFEFEKNPDNVKRAAKDFGVTYPIVQDNNFAIWKAYHNNYWPAEYLIDKDGNIRREHFGEGNYDETEMAIRELLGETAGTDSLVNIPGYTIQTRSPETYLGYWRIENFASSPGIQKDKLTIYQSPGHLETNDVVFVGSWNIREKFAEASPGASLKFRFDAKNVNLVMKPVKDGTKVKVNILRGTEKVETREIEEDRLYSLLQLDSPMNDTVTVEFPDGGVEVYAFTFG